MDSIFVPERFDASPVEHRRKIASGVNQVGEALLDQADDIANLNANAVFSPAPTRVSNIWQGTATEYAALTPDLDTLYYLVDTKQIFLGDVEFASSETQRQGYYNQVTDQIAGGGALDAASNYNDFDFFELIADGLFSTSIPELNGLQGNIGDKIIAVSGSWVLQALGSTYVTIATDQNIDSIKTFLKPAAGFNPALDPSDYERKQEVESKDSTTLANANTYTDGEVSTHAALTAAANDAHGSLTYTNEQITAHKGESAVNAEVHGVREYTQSVTEPIDQDLQAHKAITDWHWSDAPADGSAYVRIDNGWKTATNIGVIIGPPANGSLGTGGFRLVNWMDARDAGLMSGSTSAVSGGITLPEDGYYTFVAAIYGNQGNNTKEESMWLQLEVTNSVAGGIFDIAHESVDTDKTSARSMVAIATRPGLAGEIIYLRMRASAGLGTFQFDSATFEIEKKI